MIAEATQHYLGVICIHCGQPIPLAPSAERKERELNEQGPRDLGEFSVFSVTLRCRECHGEGVYTRSVVIDLDGAPRKRRSRATTQR